MRYLLTHKVALDVTLVKVYACHILYWLFWHIYP